MPVVDNELVPDRHQGPFIPLDLPLHQWIFDCLQRNLHTHGDGPWITDVSTGSSIKYSQIKSLVDRLSTALHHKGFRRGSSVILMASNFVQLPLFTLAVWSLGGCLAALTLNLPPEEIYRRAQLIDPAFIVTDSIRLERVRHACSRLRGLRGLVVIDQGATRDVLSFNQLIEEGGKTERSQVHEEVDMNSMCWLMFSSGTTGTPKAIVHTHRTLMNSLDSIRNFVGSQSNVKNLLINPLVNSGGLGLSVTGTILHAQMYLLSDYSDDNFLSAIHKVQPRIVDAFPSQIAYICTHPQLEEYDLSSVQIFSTGGSKTSPHYERLLFDKLTGLIFLNIGYGLSETGVCTNTQPAYRSLAVITKQDAISRHVYGSCGRVLPHCRLKVVDGGGKKLSAGELGEICIRTPGFMIGYLDDPKATADLFRDGWCHTGDQGYYDAQGNVFITGRYKELIKYRMAHVIPTNIENILMSHPAVREAAVVGIADDLDDEIPAAFVVLVPSSADVTEDELIRYVQERVADEERLRGGIRFVAEIPRNDGGKPLRRLLQMQIAQELKRN